MKQQLIKHNKIITLSLLICLSVSAYFLFWGKAETAVATWWNDSWSYRKALTINSDQVAGDLTNFPVLVSLTDTNLSGHAQEDGNDFIFIDKEGKKLSHEIESYASSTGVLVAWVKIPALSSTADTDIFMYYGNAGVGSQQDGENVWGDSYKGVWHLNQATSTDRTDSTINANTMTDYNSVGSASGKIGQSLDLEASNSEYLKRSSSTLNGLNINGADQNLTLSAWVWRESDTGNSEAIIAMWEYGYDQRQYLLNVDLTDAPGFHLNDTGLTGGGDSAVGAVDATTGAWHYIVGTYNDTDMRVYLDGNLDSGVYNPEGYSAGIFDSWSDFSIGGYFNSGTPDRFWDGKIDEARVSTVARSANWIQTEYNNQNNPSLFFAEQAEEVGPGPVGYWSFDEGYGSTAHDESANKNDGTISGAVWKDESECVVGKCLWFDGSDDYVEIPGTGFFDNVPDIFSISVWIRPISLGENSQSRIIDSGAGSLNGPFTLQLAENNRLAGQTYDGTNHYEYSSNNLVNLNEWQQIMMVYDSGTYSFYKDGVFDVSQTGGRTGLSDASTVVRIGMRNSDTLRDFEGYIDEVKIYPYARTADQVKQDYNAGLAGIGSDSGVSVAFGGASDKWMSDGLVGYWKMDETATTSGAVDSSGNGNDGTYYGNASTTGGRFGNGGVFASTTNDYVDVGNDDSLNFEGDIAVAMWFKIDEFSSGYANFLITHGAPGSGTGLDLLVWDYGNVDVSIGDGDSNSIDFSSATGIISTGQWYHVVVVANSANQTGYVYIDGEEVASKNINGYQIKDDDDNWKISKGKYSNFYPINGQIDEVRIYNRALSKSEVRKLYEWAPGPVLHLKMDEMSGGTAYDSVASSSFQGGNDGTISGASWTPLGKFGSTLNFDGSDDYVNSGNDSKLDIVAGTIMAWVKPESLINSYPRILSKEQSTQGESFALYINQSTGAAHLFVASTYVVNSTTDFRNKLNEWTHVAVTADGTNSIMYINGVNEDSAAHGGFPITAYDLYVGRNSNNTRQFDGLIDDARVYNYARTQKQILEDMSGSASGGNGGGSASKMPVLHLSFDEGRGETVHDSSPLHQGSVGQANNGTIFCGTGGSQAATSSMWEKGGKVKGAMEFDGTDDYVSVPDSVSLDGDGEMEAITIAYWVKPLALSSSYNYSLYKDGSYELIVRSSGRLHCAFDAENTGWVFCDTQSSDTIDIGDWAHVAVAYDGTTYTYYINGEESGSNSSQYTGKINSTSVVLQMGNSTAPGNFEGLIDEVKIWNFALNEDEIKQEYNSGGAIVMGGGDASADDDGITVTGASTEYCIPGDTATCTPPVLELKMDEMSGGTVYDTSGQGNDGTISGASWATVGKFGSALDFDGVNDYVEVEYTSELAPTSELSVSMWAYMDDWTDLNDLTYPEFISKTESGGYTIIADDSGTVGSNNIGFVVRRNGTYGDAETATANLSSGWHHFYGTYDGRYIRFFVDGIMVDTDDAGASYAIQYSVNNPLCISADADSSTSDCLNTHNVPAIIDQVKIYNYARTPAQIAWDYNKGKPIAHYKFDECYGSVIHDESGNSNHGALVFGSGGVTATGTCASSSDSFWYNGRTGKKNAGGSFDGTDDYIDIGDTGYDVNSVSFWFKQDYTDAYMIDLGGGNYTITLADSVVTASGFSSPTIYVDGESKSTVPDNAWHYILVTTTSAIDASSTKIGLISSDYFTGQIDEVKLYNYTLTAEQAKTDFSGGAVGFGYSGIQSGSALIWTCGISKLGDIDDNTYATALIGTQCWMAENLVVTKNADGSAVDGTGDADTTPPSAYSDADGGHDSADANWEVVEGYLYNWEDTMNGSTVAGAQGICPDNWHLPTHDEWTDLERYICETEGNGSCDTTFPKDTSTIGFVGTNEGTELKNTTNVNGVATDPNGDDGYDFSVLMAGLHDTSGGFFYRGTNAYFWSSSELGSNAWFRNFGSSNANVYRGDVSKGRGHSVRCLKD